MSLIYTIFVPHPPLLIPEVGRGEERKCQASLDAYQEVARRIAQAEVETVILVSPHAPLIKDGMTLAVDNIIQGSFAQFGAAQVSLSFESDLVVMAQFQNLSGVVSIQGSIDHGAFVPLYFLQKAGWKGKVVLLGMPLERPEEYGERIGQILEDLPGRYAIVASGDLSHRLKEDGPYGFDSAGPEFDQFVVNTLQRDSKKIDNLSDALIDKAGECGYRSLRLALAAKEGAPEVLSYEGPFGVGYLVADLYHSSPLPRWARRCLTTFLKKGGSELLDLADMSTPELTGRRGCFVTLKQGGNLRGCIGTTEPWQENLALEIQHNAIAAGTQDPRFRPVRSEELDTISFTVDVLGELEKIAGPEGLDPWKYGVVVRQRGRSGLLLPHLEGVDTVSDQINIAKQKAGIPAGDSVELWRFEVKRHYE
ncbi:AmmeMemoRadiSam system protein A [Desulfosporosinus nitroreducens]|uniref:AmmeMemoRadiSam system protein A n=1 Tax=Desulfosporosinus nitroreducens TaxID=2018668 RepID=UPI00207C5F93|nr:AmmeMemoRadiSam system protein A [Desulfosporosinus nitroreducens]MCO1602383.1 AmmeMemoRadiSam system protein A [Desulfosporosinus nitroreducens]